MTMRSTKLVLPALLALLTLSGCTTNRSPYLDSHFGQAVEFAKSQQTLNPEASQNPDPVAGIGGRAARDSLERYESTFRRPPPQTNVFGIGVSGGGGQ